MPETTSRKGAPLAYIYDRRTSPTAGVLTMRLGLCRLAADEQGWQVAGEFVDDEDHAFADAGRPAFDRMLTAMRAAHVEGSQVVCLVAEWRRLSRDEDAEQAFRARIATAGGYTATATGEDDRDEPRIGPALKAAR